MSRAGSEQESPQGALPDSARRRSRRTRGAHPTMPTRIRTAASAAALLRGQESTHGNTALPRPAMPIPAEDRQCSRTEGQTRCATTGLEPDWSVLCSDRRARVSTRRSGASPRRRMVRATRSRETRRVLVVDVQYVPRRCFVPARTQSVAAADTEIPRRDRRSAADRGSRRRRGSRQRIPPHDAMNTERRRPPEACVRCARAKGQRSSSVRDPDRLGIADCGDQTCPTPRSTRCVPDAQPGGYGIDEPVPSEASGYRPGPSRTAFMNSS